MIKESEVVPMLLRQFPEFKKYWDDHWDYLGEENEFGLCGKLFPFTRYALDLLNLETAEADEILHKMFDISENLMTEGNETIRTAIATCFLEDISNRFAEEPEKNERFKTFLGPESLGYCEAWEELWNPKS